MKVESSIMDEKDRQAKIGAALRSAEASIKNGELEEALEKVRTVYTMDHKSMYAHAFEERILGMLEERELKIKEEKGKASAPASVPETCETDAAVQEHPENPPQSAQPEPVVGTADAVREAIEIERKRAEEEKAFIIERERLKTKERLLEAYRAFVMLMDVSIPKEQLDTLLLSLRGILDVSQEDHEGIVRSIQVNSYIDTLHSMWRDGKVTADEQDVIKQMRDLYGISPEEHERLNREVKRRLGIPDQSGSIPVVDDSAVKSTPLTNQDDPESVRTLDS